MCLSFIRLSSPLTSLFFVSADLLVSQSLLSQNDIQQFSLTQYSLTLCRLSLLSLFSQNITPQSSSRGDSASFSLYSTTQQTPATTDTTSATTHCTLYCSRLSPQQTPATTHSRLNRLNECSYTLYSLLLYSISHRNQAVCKQLLSLSDSSNSPKISSPAHTLEQLFPFKTPPSATFLNSKRLFKAQIPIQFRCLRLKLKESIHHFQCITIKTLQRRLWSSLSAQMSTLDHDILHPSVEQEKRMNKKKTLVPNPRSEFISLRCPSCNQTTNAFSHSNIPVTCESCKTPLAFPTGGRLRLVENVESRSKATA